MSDNDFTLSCFIDNILMDIKKDTHVDRETVIISALIRSYEMGYQRAIKFSSSLVKP